MEVSQLLNIFSKTQESMHQLPIRAVAYALEVIPRTLAMNCGADVVRVMTDLRAKHTNPEGFYYGVDGNKGNYYIPYYHIIIIIILSYSYL